MSVVRVARSFRRLLPPQSRHVSSWRHHQWTNSPAAARLTALSSCNHGFDDTTTRGFATHKKQPTRANEGRIVSMQKFVKQKKQSGSRLCVGCGVEVKHGGGGGMVGGEAAVKESGHSKKMQKKLRYVDVTTEKSGFLCDRCKALKSDNIWKAYDALYDVSAEVFAKQLQHIVARRRFGLCILVVDSTDPEHSAMKSLRKCIGGVPCMLVFTKTDLVPRMSRGDQKALKSGITHMNGARFIDSFAVSSVTGKGITRLAQAILGSLQGRDVFVVGAANVGKSTLVKKLAGVIAEAVYMKGRKGARRRDQASNLSVTGSHLPGTTLQAVRIPCFSKSGHALWDTPGFINSKAIQYGIFPVHLMEPLARPARIPIPSRENWRQGDLFPGSTMLIEADWMEEDKDEEPCVLGRIDVVDVQRGRSVYSRAFLHPSLRVRIVLTEEAPDVASIPTSFIRKVNDRMRNTKLQDEYSLPLKPFVNPPNLPQGKVLPKDTEWNESVGKYFMDISFASLGWIAFAHDSKFAVIPHVVQGSVFSRRRSLYPLDLNEYQEAYDEYDDLDPDSIQRLLREASSEGRHQQQGKSHGGGELDFYEEYDEWY